jgi:hypothetical protein
MKGQRRVRDLGGALRFAHLRRLGIPLDDLERLTVASGTIGEGGLYVEAETGESRLLQAGDLVPLGTWIAHQDIAAIENSGPTAAPTPERDWAAGSPSDGAVTRDRDDPPLEREVPDGGERGSAPR